MPLRDYLLLIYNLSSNTLEIVKNKPNRVKLPKKIPNCLYILFGLFAYFCYIIVDRFISINFNKNRFAHGFFFISVKVYLCINVSYLFWSWIIVYNCEKISSKVFYSDRITNYIKLDAVLKVCFKMRSTSHMNFEFIFDTLFCCYVRHIRASTYLDNIKEQ